MVHNGKGLGGRPRMTATFLTTVRAAAKPHVRRRAGKINDMENVTYTYGKTHELKTWPSYYNAIVNGVKHFEVRKADRPFKVGDTLLLREYNPNNEQYTGACVTREISYILQGGQFRIEAGYVGLGLAVR